MPSKRTKRGLAAEIGRKIQALRKARGLKLEAAALHLGIGTQFLRYVESGRVLPTPELQARVIGVFYGGKSWQHAPTLRSSPTARPEETEWHRVHGWVSPATFERLNAFCRDTGYSRESAVTVALSRLLDTGAANIVTIREAIRAVEEARLAELLIRQPDLQRLLDADVQLAKALGLKVPLEPVEGRPYLRGVPEDRIKTALEVPVEVAEWVRRLEKV